MVVGAPNHPEGLHTNFKEGGSKKFSLWSRFLSCQSGIFSQVIWLELRVVFRIRSWTLLILQSLQLGQFFHFWRVFFSSFFGQICGSSIMKTIFQLPFIDLGFKIQGLPFWVYNLTRNKFYTFSPQGATAWYRGCYVDLVVWRFENPLVFSVLSSSPPFGGGCGFYKSFFLSLDLVTHSIPQNVKRFCTLSYLEVSNCSYFCMTLWT